MKKKYILTLFISCLFLSSHCFSFAQSSAGKISREEYIENYKDEAVKDMLKTGVPASITLAQAMLESDNGNSSLAKEANNHFGIKCHSDWTGKTFFQDDDKKNECFRKYSSVLESYDDHSVFLRTRQRYALLFELPRSDYKGWSHGLKKAGYATNPDYATLLIRIIEENRLYELDGAAGAEDIRYVPPKKISPSGRQPAFNRKVLVRNNVKYVTVEKGDTYYKVSKEFEMGLWQIYQYNELDKNTPLKEGQVLYLQPKRRKAKQEYHIVNEGETYYSISQMHAIKLKHLYKKNHLTKGAQPVPGQKLWLRKQKAGQ